MQHTVAEYARHRGCSEAYVHRLVREGKLTKLDGRIDAEQADETLGPPKGKRAPSKARPADYYAERAKREAIKAKREQLALEREQGRLVEADGVKRAAFARGQAVRDALLNIPDRLAPIVAAEADAKKVHQVLTDELRRALEALADAH